jgi:hypothetical protein
MRFHFFEFEDQRWFPATIREGGTDYLRYFLKTTGFYEPSFSQISALQKETGTFQIIDLCSGGGGETEHLYEELQKSHPESRITLTDKFPNISSFRYLSDKTGGKIGFYKDPVDASNVPAEMKGIRTMFSATHHFEPEQLRTILVNAVESRQPIALFDGGDKKLLMIAGLILVHPVAFLLFTPFFKPFRLSRICFTYLLPFIPLMTIWDGIVSVLRLYKPEQLLAIARSIPKSGYVWESGKKRNKAGFSICYLIGRPE